MFYLESFPFIGPITKFHLAKNIGIDVAKPDRHLSRISKMLGFASVQELCESISQRIDEKVSVVDLVIWRYATIDKKYLEKIGRYLT